MFRSIKEIFLSRPPSKSKQKLPNYPNEKACARKYKRNGRKKTSIRMMEKMKGEGRMEAKQSEWNRLARNRCPSPRLTTFSIKSQGCSQRDGDADDRIANPAINTSKRAGISPRGRYNLHPRPLIHSLEKAARVQCTVK